LLCTVVPDRHGSVLLTIPVHVHRASFQRRPLFQEHLGMNKLFDQDNVSGANIIEDNRRVKGMLAWLALLLAYCQQVMWAPHRVWLEDAYVHSVSGGLVLFFI
jgi:hypothetical protein